MHARGGGATDLLRQVRAEPTTLISDPSRELRAFRIAQSAAAGTKRGSGRGAFIDSVLHAIDDFYEQIIQNLKPWMPAAPRLRTSEDVIPVQPVASSLVSTAISSQDSPEFDTQGTPGGSGSADRTDE